MLTKNFKHRVKLPEMARLLSRSPKQFRRDVANYEIPHLKLGRDKLFDPEEVEQLLLSKSFEPRLSRSRSSTKSKPVNSSLIPKTLPENSTAKERKRRYEIMLGLS